MGGSRPVSQQDCLFVTSLHQTTFVALGAAMAFIVGAASAHDDQLTVTELVNTGTHAQQGQAVLVVSGTHEGESIRCSAFDASGKTIATRVVPGGTIATPVVLSGDMSSVTRFYCSVEQ